MGRSVGQRPWPSTTCRSLWQTPVAAVRTRTSRPDGLSISTDSIVRGSCGLRKTAAFISMARSSLRQLPAEPVADRAAHDQLPVAARQPRQLLREHRHALPPRARHARDVGAPEHPRGAEGVVDPPQVTVDVAIGIGLARVARRAGGLDGHVRVLRQREHVAEIAPGRVVLRARRSPEVIDDQLESRMLLGDLRDLRQEIGREPRHRDARALGRGPHPVDGAVDWVWAAAERAGIPVARLAANFLPKVAQVAEQHPGLKLIIDHLGRPSGTKDDAAWGNLGDMLALAKHPNVAIKATGAPSYSSEPYPYRNIHGHLRRIYDAFGPERMFWGTDITRMPCSWRECVTMFTEELPWLSGRDLERVMGQAVCDWLGWKLPQ